MHLKRTLAGGKQDTNVLFPSFQDVGEILVHDTLDRDGGGFTAADAQRGNATLEMMRLQRVKQGHDQPRAGGSDRVTESAGATMNVELFAGNAEIALRSHRHHRKGLVDLEQVNVADA